MKASACIRFKFSSKKDLSTVFEALKPETKILPARSRATLQKEGEFLVLEVEACDTVALRATLNAYLRWENSIVSVLQVLNVH